MSGRKRGIRVSAILLAGSLVCCLAGPVATLASQYGRLTGIVSDNRGNPLMGATVLIIGPLLIPTASTADQVERVITDAKGKFAVGHLVPGWYSLQIASPTRLPARRNGVKVEAGQTSALEFVLADVFAPLRFQLPNGAAGSVGDDWKWVLRTSVATRPILRYLPQTAATRQAPLPAHQHLVGIVPASSGRNPLANDSGTASVVAYLRPLSLDSDLLTVGSVAANGTLTSSVGTQYRKGLVKGDPAELSLVVHQLGYAGAPSSPGVGGPLSDSSARGLVASYRQTLNLRPNLSLVVGMETEYLNAIRDASLVQPQMKLTYRVSPSTDLALQVGRTPSDGSGTLLERVGRVDFFPLLTLRGYRPELEQIDHSEVSLKRRVGSSARLEAAAYDDGIKNAAVSGSGDPSAVAWLAGNYMLNLAAGGSLVNVGDYHSSGFRVAYAQRVGKHVEAVLAYVNGESLCTQGIVSRAAEGDLQGVLKSERSQSMGGRVSAQIPVTKTRVTTSYMWVQRGRVTMLDPYGQADLQLEPFLDIQVRQPLPAPAFLPAHFEAIADFQNLLGQGYSPLTKSGQATLLLGSVYQSVRGGLSVEF